jgi:hypothetical protein
MLMIWHLPCVAMIMSAFSGQIILVGTAVCEGFDARVAKGARCPMICVCDCDTLIALGKMADYETEVGFNAGLMLDETLGRSGWSEITVRACVPVADKDDGWEPEVAALILTARTLGIAHMVFEPQSVRPSVLH